MITFIPSTKTINNYPFTTTYTYDEYDRITSQTYPSGKVIGYEYDDKGDLMDTTLIMSLVGLVVIIAFGTFALKSTKNENQ